jgi:hypothetical protein
MRNFQKDCEEERLELVKKRDSKTGVKKQGKQDKTENETQRRKESNNNKSSKHRIHEMMKYEYCYYLTAYTEVSMSKK